MELQVKDTNETCTESEMEKWQRWEAYTLKQIERTAVRMEPYPHLYIRNIFHRELYAQLVEFWPDHEHFDGQKIAAGGRDMHCPDPDLRKILLADDAEITCKDPTEREFWKNFNNLINGVNLSLALVSKSKQSIVTGRKDLPAEVSITPHAVLEWEQDTFSVTPHLDSYRYLMTCIFYTPAGFEKNHLGTALLSPKPHLYEKHPNLDEDFVPGYWDWDDFDEVTRVPFIPNTMFGLIVSTRCYHSLPPIVDSGDGRKNILLNIYHNFKAPFISLRERRPDKYPVPLSTDS